ncbi:hypothetical protein BELL_0514g00060 [Botrytis elliptica]|uniref:Uncharacterized protein n=1 Tax=Botrytis elliptica TaxID=278938 RepID=A0A4Z1JKA7_9HELO|nr:hypothetical protein EAE99_012160 [Botrytis elliptica]TGO71910.1 hypothetical protein BELL_0514g00060 [Botrytis elliptica]
MGKRDDICSFLGYEKDNPTKDRRNLLKSTSAFLADYEARGNKVYGRKAESIGGRLCAVNFLEEEGRGERFWPPASDGSLVYEQARDKEIIIDHVADLFLIHARSNYSKLHAKRRSQKHNATSPPSNVNNEHISNKPSALSTPEETYLEDEEPQFTYSSSLMTIKPELCLTPWLDPPKRFDRNVAMPWAERIDPKNLPDPPIRLGKDWLSQKSVQWPSAVDKEIQYFMHRWLFYYTNELENGTDDGIQSLVSLLRKKEGTSAELDGTQLQEFRRRIIDRVRHWTETFINHQFVELQADGVPQMTARFRAIWTTLKYDTPTPRVSNRRRSVEEETPPETHRKRRKLSKKSEDNALDGSRSKRKPWTENAWRRKTIPPPADMTFPNLISRKSSIIDPVTVVVTPRASVNEEDSDEERFQKCEVHEGSEHTIRNSKISVEIPSPYKVTSSKADVFIKMEEESTIEVSQLGTTVIEVSDDERSSEATKLVVPTQGAVIKSPSPNPDDTMALETTPPHVQDGMKGPEAKLILSHQSSNTSEGRNVSQQSEILDAIIMPNQSSKTIVDGPPIDKAVDAQAEVIDPHQLSTQVEHSSQLLQTTNEPSSPKAKGDQKLRIEVSTQPIDLDEKEFTKVSTPKELNDSVDEPRRPVAKNHQILTEDEDHNVSVSMTPPESQSSENPRKYGPFNDIKILNQLFSSNGSRTTDTHRQRGTSSISPTSSADADTHEMEKNSFPTNANPKHVLPRASSSIEFVPKEGPEELPNQSESPTVNKASMEGLSTLSQSPKTSKPQSGHSIYASSLNVLERSQKSSEKNDSILTRTPLPSGPLPSETGQEISTLLPIIEQATTTISENPKPNVSSQIPSQNPVQETQAASRDSFVSGFQPINRPISSLSTQSPPAPISHSLPGVYKPSIAPQEPRDQRYSQQTKEMPKQSEAIFSQNIGREIGRSSEPSWTRNVHLNSYPVNSQNGVYPMAFVSKPTASKNDLWMQETSRKRQLERTDTKPRKTKSRKKSMPCEKQTTVSGTVQYPLASSAPATQNATPSAMQTQSPRQPDFDQERSPKPPHPELISHLRIMDEKMGTNSGASYQHHIKTMNSPIISNQPPNNHGRNLDQNMTTNYDARQEQNILSPLFLQEQMHSKRKRSSEDWGNTKSPVGMHHATSVGSPAQSQRTSSMSQKRPSIPENIQISRMEQERFQHGMQQNRRLPNAGENKLDSQNGKQEVSNLPKLDIQIKINPGAITARNQVQFKENVQTRADIETRNQRPESANMGQSESVRLRETETRHGTPINSGTGRKTSKSLSLLSPQTSQYLKDLPGTQDRVHNNVQQSSPAQINQHLNQQSQGPKTNSQIQANSSSPELYRSQDPWWNSLATDYNISTIPKQPSRYVPQTNTNMLHNRTMSNTTPVPTVASASQVQIGSQEPLPETRQVAPQATERPHSTGSQASKVFHQIPESQRAKYPLTKPSNTEHSPPQSYSVNENSTQSSQAHQFNPSGQSAQLQFGVRPSPSQNEISKQAPIKSSNESTPSPTNQSHQPVTQPLNRPLTSSKSQYNNNVTSQPPNTQTSNFHRQLPNQHPVQPTIIQSPVPQHQFINRPPAQFSPVQASFPRNQYTGPSPTQQASTAPSSYNTEYAGQQRAISQYQYPKRPQQPQQPAEPQNTTTHPQKKIYNEPNPHDHTKSRLNGASPRTIIDLVSASPMQSPTIQIPASQPSLATTMSAILNPKLPPTPPTPAIIPTTGSDSMSKYPPNTQSMSETPLRQQASAIVPTPKYNSTSHHYHPATYPPQQQTPIVNPTPKIDTASQYSNPTQSLATPQQTPTTPQGAGPKLDFYLQRSSSLIDTSISFSYQYMESLSLSNLFAFFSQRSGIPLERLDDLTFRCMFGEYQQFVIGKNMGDGEWKRARKRIWRNWDRDVKSAKQNGDDEDEEFWEVNILIGRCA